MNVRILLRIVPVRERDTLPEAAVTGTNFRVLGAIHECEGLDTELDGVAGVGLVGREVAMLVNENLASGKYDIAFNAAGLSSGVYFYRLTAGGMIQTKKMILQK